jgi:hypothetical protein
VGATPTQSKAQEVTYGVGSKVSSYIRQREIWNPVSENWNGLVSCNECRKRKLYVTTGEKQVKFEEVRGIFAGRV